MIDLIRRPAVLATDYDQLYALQQESYLVNFPGQVMQEQWFRTALEAAIISQRVWVYVHADEIIGWLWLDWDEPLLTHIYHLQVKGAYWGQGIGHRLVSDAVKQAEDAGKQAVTLNVTKSNLRAMALYTRFRFRVEEDNGDRQAMRLELKPRQEQSE